MEGECNGTRQQELTSNRYSAINLRGRKEASYEVHSASEAEFWRFFLRDLQGDCRPWKKGVNLSIYVI
jgi:hypothetical protein